MSSSSSLILQVKKVSPCAILPTRATAFSAGYDLYSLGDDVVKAQTRKLIPSGIAMMIPNGYYGRIAPRSGLAVKKWIDVGAGVIDGDFTDQVMVLLINHSFVDYEIKAGDRIAQLILEKMGSAEVVEVAELEKTVRGGNGFGSTGR